MKKNDDARKEYEQNFNNKIDALKDHPKYSWLRGYADEALNFHIGSGFLAIKAIDFMDKIIKNPVENIRDWLDGKSKYLY